MYVYTYYVPELNAIKIGHGSNPEARMDSYSYAHGFTPDHSSLRTWYCGANDPRTLEGYVHNKIGLRRLQYRRATELFALNGTYEQAVEKVDKLIGVDATDPGKAGEGAKIAALIFSGVVFFPFILLVGWIMSLGGDAETSAIGLVIFAPVLGFVLLISGIIWAIGWRIIAAIAE